MKRQLLILTLLAAGLLSAGAQPRQDRTLSDGWTIKPITRTAKGFVGDPVTLPHTWNTWYMPDTLWYNREMMVYQRTLERTPDMDGKRVYLYFEGANSVMDLFVNQRQAGEHKGGYTACCFEITDYLHAGTNQIEVWVSNAYRSDVLPISGDFNVCGGLHRPVHLIVTGRDCISPLFYASPGLLVRQDKVSAQRAELRAETILSLGGGNSLDDYSLRTTVRDASGAVVASASSLLSRIAPRKDDKGLWHAVLPLQVDHPHLWDGKADPYLYTVTTALYRGETLLDQVSEQTGLRYFHVDPDRGFFLNGHYLDLVGCCRHEDMEGRGSALTMEDYERDFALIRELGATAMRLAHYPHGEPVYELADRDGIILMTEIPLCGPGGYGYTGYLDKVQENAREVLQELVYQKFHHPSIVFWGIFNEILVNDGRFEQYDDPIPFIKELNALYHACDPSRLTTFATCVEQSHYLDCADLIAWNKYFGWYGDGARDAGAFFDQARAEANGKPVGVSEYGAGGSALHHQWPLDKAARPSGRYHPEEAQADCHEGNWEAFSERPWLWSKFVWVFADFPSAIRHEGDRDGINDKGLLTRDRQTKKDAFYFYKANWNPEPMVYISARRFTQRTEPVTDVRVYSNLPSATLYLNGKSLGTAKKDKLNRIIWEGVRLRPGENEIIVQGRSGRQTLADTCRWVLFQQGPEATALEGPVTVIPATPATLTQALAQAAKAVRQPRNVVVELADGSYELSEPIVLDERYSPREGFRLVFRPAEGAAPVISGGRKVSGWTRVEGNLWKAPFACDHKVRTMIVDGQRALMAQASVQSDGLGVSERFPISGNESWAFGAGQGVAGIRLAANPQICEFRNPGDVELVQSKTWTEKILCLESVQRQADGSYVARLQQPLGAIINSMAWAGKIDYRGKFHLRNAFELLDEPGEFYFDRSAQTLYYMSDGRDVNEMEIVVPRSEGLLRLYGSSNASRIRGIAFEGITFAYDAWNLMELEGSRGFGGIQSLGLATRYIPDGNWHPTKYNSCGVPPGCIDIRNACDVSIERCRFEHLGCATAIAMTNDVQCARIVGNVFQDILGNSLTVGHPQHYEIGDGEGVFPPGVEGLCQDILVSNNYVRNVCLDFRQVEVMVGFFVRRVQFLHNDIQYCPYGAIALGWWWGNAEIPESTVAGDNVISFNRIGNTHQLLSDGGAIYVLGRQPRSVMEGNYVFSSPRSLYPDDGSSGWDIHHNFVNTTYKAWLHIASDRDYDIRVYDNYVKDNYLINDGVGVQVLRTENFRNRPFSQTALDIAERAGIEAAYRDIVPGQEPPVMRIAPDFHIEKW